MFSNLEFLLYIVLLFDLNIRYCCFIIFHATVEMKITNKHNNTNSGRKIVVFASPSIILKVSDLDWIEILIVDRTIVYFI